MARTVLVEVCIPTVKMHFDMEMSMTLTIHEVLSLVYELVMERLQEGQMVSYFAIVYHVPSQQILMAEKTIAQCYIQTGDCIYIF